MQILDTIQVLRQARKTIDGKIGLVPTMGYLHDGHMSLVEYARRENDVVMATIFVNPTQFGEGEDLDAYPRDLQRDLAMLESVGVDFVFTPTPDMMYPPKFQSHVMVDEVTKGLEGAHRDGHFKGVTTIVAKLFNLVQAHTAYFGQKDAQQVVVIRQMVRDLNFPLDIIVCPIVREPDGLAMSSRNVYLNDNERQSATVLFRSIQAVGNAYERGEREPLQLKMLVEQIVGDEPLADLHYVSLADPSTLQEAKVPTDSPLLLTLAVQLGKPRLLDNCLLPLHLNTSKGLTATLGIK